MRILLDVDGVIADLVGDLCKELRTHGYDRVPEDFKAYDFTHTLTRDELLITNKAMMRPGFVQNMSWYPGAQDFVKELHKLGEVVALTKPLPFGPTWAYERGIWLQGHVEKVIQTAHKELVHGEVLIEDFSTNAIRWQRANPEGTTILIERPWCRGDVATYIEALLAVSVEARNYAS